jgi:hypothetical protein
MAPQAPTAESGPLLLADISGYTSFLQSVASAHQADAFANGAIPDAYAMMSHLLDGIVECVMPPFTLSKLEGDAVFAYGLHGQVPTGQALLGCLVDCYSDFRQRLGAAHQIWSCGCLACARIDDLDLKFVLHAGAFVLQPIAGRQELAGPEVVLAHRLLKSGAAEVIGGGAYVLITSGAADRLDVPTENTVPLVETYEHYPPIQTHVYPLRIV